MPRAEREGGDPELHRIFEEFDSQVVSPGGAANLLGVSRKTVDTLCARGVLRRFVGPEQKGPLGTTWGPRWAYIPLRDVAEYAARVGRPFPKSRTDQWGGPPRA